MIRRESLRIAKARERQKKAALGFVTIQVELSQEEAFAYLFARERQRGPLAGFAARALVTGAKFLANAGNPRGRKIVSEPKMAATPIPNLGGGGLREARRNGAEGKPRCVVARKDSAGIAGSMTDKGVRESGVLPASPVGVEFNRDVFVSHVGRQLFQEFPVSGPVRDGGSHADSSDCRREISTEAKGGEINETYKEMA